MCSINTICYFGRICRIVQEVKKQESMENTSIEVKNKANKLLYFITFI